MKTILFLDCDQKERAPDPRLQCGNHIWSLPPVLDSLITLSVIPEGGIRDGHYLQRDSCCTTELTIYGGRVMGEESIICCFLGESL